MDNRNGPLIIAEMFIKLIIYYKMTDTKGRESISTGQYFQQVNTLWICFNRSILSGSVSTGQYSLDLFLNISIII